LTLTASKGHKIHITNRSRHFVGSNPRQGVVTILIVCV
jgi:hypothetical protein